MIRSPLMATLAICVLSLTSCGSIPRQIEIGETDSQGRLIFYRWTAGDQERQAVLKDGYGMMVFYDADSPRPTPRFELHIHKGHLIIRTTSLTRFKKELRRIPRGGTLHYYNTCAGGTHHGLDRSVMAEIMDYCKERHVRVQRGDDEIFVICTCL